MCIEPFEKIFTYPPTHNSLQSAGITVGYRNRIFNPRLKKWHRHFTWSENFLSIVGRTRIGRATVEALNMNRLEQVNMRMALRALRKYPPEIDGLSN
jgi:hypothetical protein